MSITSFTTDNNVTSIDLESGAGDDRGGIAVTTSGVIDQGDGYAVLLNSALDTAMEVDLTQDQGDALFTDLGSSTSYFFNWTYDEPADSDGITTITGFTNVLADGNAGSTVVDLSEDIELFMYDFEEDADFREDYALLNGNGIVGIWDMGAGDLTIIDIATGAVSHIAVNSNDDFDVAGTNVLPIMNDGETDETFYQWGVLEFDGTDYSYFGPTELVENGDPTVARLPLTAEATDTAETFAEDIAGEDFWRIVPDCANGHWYTHIENSNENVYAADVTCVVDAAEAEELPNTGADFSTGLGVAAALTAAGALLVARRRAQR